MTATLEASPELEELLALELVRNAAGRSWTTVKAIDAIPLSEDLVRDARLKNARYLLVAAHDELIAWQRDGGE